MPNDPATTTPDPAVRDVVLTHTDPPAADRHGNPGHDTAAATERRIRAVNLRNAGATYQQIADALGYSHPSTARHLVMDALRAVEAADVTEGRALENARYDQAQAAIWPKVMAGDVKAVQAFINLSARRAKLNGWDAPVKVEVSQGVQAELNDALSDLQETVSGWVVSSSDDDDTGEPPSDPRAGDNSSSERLQ